MFEIEDPIVYYKSSENMEEVKDNSIQLIVTSPPYGKIKDYGSKEQIGFSDSFEEYFQRLKRVWSECCRVLEPQCRLIINIGDQYLRTSEYGRYRILSIASQIITDCQALGFDFLGDIIWQKVSTTNTTGGCSLMGSIYYPRNGLLTYDYEHILIFKKLGNEKGRIIDLQTKENSKISLSEWKKWYVGHWRFPGVLQKEHVAMFPDELPYRLIRMFTFIGDTVLDPFLGSGTTLKVARSLFRKGIGYEINKDYKKIIDNKINQSDIEQFRDYQYMIYKISQKLTNENIEICFEEQKQKGILILKNMENHEIIIDYLHIDQESVGKALIFKELNAKLEENTVLNFLNRKDKWIHFKKYYIVVNLEKYDTSDSMNQIMEVIESFNFPKDIQFILMNKIVSNDVLLSSLF